MLAIVRKKILDLSLSPEELFERVFFEKMISLAKEETTKFRLTIPGEKPLIVTMKMFPGDREDSFKFSRLLTGDIISGGNLRGSFIAYATFSKNNDVKIESFLGKGATIGNLFNDFRAFPGRENLLPIDIGGVLLLHRFVFYPDRTTLEEIYRACDQEKLELWEQKTTREIPLSSKNRPDLILSGEKVVNFTRKYGRPPYFTKTNDFEIKHEKPLSVELFNQNVVLFEKNLIKNGGSFTLTYILWDSANDCPKNLFLDFVYPDGKEEKNIVISGHNHDILGESLVQIVKNLPVEDFLRRVSLATEKEFSSDLLFVTERMISRDPSKRLKEGDLKILAGILAGTTECRLEKKNLVSAKDHSTHNLLVAYMSKLFLDSNGRVTRKMGNFVLADNGELLKGRFVLGGDDSLRENLVRRQLKLVESDLSWER